MSTSPAIHTGLSPADAGKGRLTADTHCTVWTARGPKRTLAFSMVDFSPLGVEEVEAASSSFSTTTERRCISDRDRTDVVIQRNLDRLAAATDELAAGAIVRDLLAGAVDRLHWLCACMLYRSYPRLTRPPINLHADELLSFVVERMIKAMRSVRPHNVRQFFAVCNQHMRWELNDLARRLDKQPQACQVNESLVAAELPSSCSHLSPKVVRILEAIDGLPDAEREMFDLVRLQGLRFSEAASIAGVCYKTVQRRLNRALMLLSERLADLDYRHSDEPGDSRRLPAADVWSWDFAKGMKDETMTVS